ncbi:MAG: DNA-formamidopyrimidine glycosylase family protein [Bacteroidota bacterium]
MPELPEVEGYKKYIDSTSLQQKITGIDCADNRLLKKELGLFESALVGQSFIETRRIGKYLFLQTTGDKVLIMHFGMTGKPEYYYDPNLRPKYAHIVYEFANGYHLGFLNRRKFGWNDLTESVEDYQQKVGLSTDARDLSFEDFQKSFDKRKTSIKPVLMNQSVAAGIGNWMADEILYQSEIHPEKKTNQLSEGQIKTIFDRMKAIIETAIEKEAVYRNFPPHYFIHIRRTGAQCHHTSSKIKKLTVGGRSTYYSPEWQK